MFLLEFTIEEEFRIYELMARKDFILGDNFTKQMKNNSFVQSFRKIVEDISAGSRIIQSLVPCLSDCKEPTSQPYATKLQQGEIQIILCYFSH